MPTIFVYNPGTGRVERYVRRLLDPMPYVTGRTMTVGEFRGSSRSNILWTDRRFLTAWNNFRRWWGRPIFIGHGFKRIWEGGHSPQSQHYTGLAIDMGHTLGYYQREAFRNFARNAGVWIYVEPQSIAPRWVHVDRRFGYPACASGGFPRVAQGSRGVYVFVLQDALYTLGYTGGGLDGIFGPRTRYALIRFQRAQGLPASGAADCVTWLRLTALANGRGATSTVIR